MDPLSSIANVASIAVILLSKLSEFVDSAKNAPAEVQRLNNELALLYSYLGRVKIVADAGINLTEEVKALLMKAIKDCETTMGTLQDLIDKSKKAETKRLLNQILKTVKFAWTEAEIKKIRAEILVEIDILDKIVKLSGLEHGNELHELLKELGQKLDTLQEAQAGRETLVLVERDDPLSEHAAFVLQDRREPRPKAKGKEAEPETTENKSGKEGPEAGGDNISNPLAWHILEEIPKKQWPVTRLEFRPRSARDWKECNPFGYQMEWTVELQLDKTLWIVAFARGAAVKCFIFEHDVSVLEDGITLICGRPEGELANGFYHLNMEIAEFRLVFKISEDASEMHSYLKRLQEIQFSLWHSHTQMLSRISATLQSHINANEKVAVACEAYRAAAGGRHRVGVEHCNINIEHVDPSGRLRTNSPTRIPARIVKLEIEPKNSSSPVLGMPGTGVYGGFIGTSYKGEAQIVLDRSHKLHDAAPDGDFW